jgi:hypothetical protein
MKIASSIKELLRPFVPQFIMNQLRKRVNNAQYIKWEKSGFPVPPPHIVKQITIGEYFDKYGYNTFVETGTGKGDMVVAQKARFERIFSIELGVDLFKKAQKRFSNDGNVQIVQGDSGKVLPMVLNDLDEPAIFWLDGHYSSGDTAKGEKDCPIFEEMDAIFNAGKYNHVILIDDARLFNGGGDYPTVEELTEYVSGKNEKYKVEVKHDIIRYII